MARVLVKIFQPISRETRDYFTFLYKYVRRRGYTWFAKFESLKDILVDLLYKRRGKYTRPFLHFGTISLVFLVITLGPLVLQQRQKEEAQAGATTVINQVQAFESDLTTSESEDVQRIRGGEVTIHRVAEGETLSSIAQTYSLDVSTIVWENELDEKAKLKPGQELRILPIDGVRHKVQRGETIYSVAKKYGLEDEAQAQVVVNYPFNEFKNSETFDLTVGQTLMVPDGVKPDPVKPFVPRQSVIVKLTPDAGAVSATGSFIWPASGKLTQGYRFFHKAFDIANRGGGPILAADSGTVIVASWLDNSGYANRVMIDHGNGFVTLYAHLSAFNVQVGQRVSRGAVVGQMGCTGRCTGTHLHFEIRQNGTAIDPSRFLR